MRVLDSSAFIHDYDPDGPVASVPAVRDELKDSAGYRFDAMAGSGMTVQSPGDDALRAVRSAALATGDRDALSETDVSVLAVAHELDATLVTDDYAMQNVAGELGVGVEAIAQEGITERRDWHFQCQGCGREFDDDRDRCPVCGSGLERKNPR
ncbi:NOB1 family endonuclease [Halobacterium zhouii]|uniref:NOB1 family endonuclease n=1 Tax=Halobacterium zhouii TaxID=2902624 RepID=UPI001E36E927|nr:NOB1 family endonuclease [Halobacterium zhouii]